MVTALNPLPKYTFLTMRGLWLAGALFTSFTLHAQTDDTLTLTIAQGDTLIGLSQRYLNAPGRWPELKRLNHIAQDKRLQPGSSLRIPVSWLRWAERSAEVIHVQGVVTGVLAGVEGPLAEGRQLRAGDRFDTGDAGTLTLRLPDGANVVFPPLTQAGLEVSREVPGTSLRATRIELRRGAVDSTVPKLKEPASRFEIHTPRVVTAVRGTRFRVAAEGDTSRHEVVSGVVAVNATGASASLQAAQGLRAESGELGAVVPLLPAPDLAGLPQRVERTAQSLSLPPLDGARAWRWQVATDAAFTRLLQDARTTAPRWLLEGLPDGDYFLRVRAEDEQGLEGQEAQQAFAMRARPEPPVLISPAPDASVAGPSALVWAQLTGAPGYRIQMARDAAFADLLLDRTLEKTMHQMPIDMAWPPATYYWRLATLRQDGSRGPFGDAAAFTILVASAMSVPEVDESGVKLAWTGPAGFNHRVQVAQTEDFAQPEYDQVVAGTRLDLPAPSAGVHFVRTQVVLSEGGSGTWSAAQHFEVPRKMSWAWWLLLLLPTL